jgi:molybdopterin synthase sulfur carrier subunit
MLSIKVCYFALLREKVGLDYEVVETMAKTYGELFEDLARKYHFDLPSSMIQVAVNDEFAQMHEQIESGAKVVFIPPVAGG